MKVVEFHKKAKIIKSKKEVDDLIKENMKKDEKMVKGMFEFIGAEGGFFEFMYRIYPDTPIQKFQFIHGEMCNIPIGLARHLNGTKQKISLYKDVEQKSNGPIKPPRTVQVTSRVKFTTEDVL